MDDDHPSMQAGHIVTRKRPRQPLDIIDITSEIIRDYWLEVEGLHQSEFTWEHRLESEHAAKLMRVDPASNTSLSTAPTRSSEMTDAILSPSEHDDTTISASTEDPESMHSYPLPTSSTDELQMLQEMHQELSLSPQVMFHSLPQIVNSGGPSPMVQTTESSPLFAPGVLDSLSDDGIFHPGSTFQELHTTFRNEMMTTARSAAPSRAGSPMRDVMSLQSVVDREQVPSLPTEDSTATVHASTSPKHFDLSPQEEFVLWKNYVEEVAPWLDKFDCHRHFERSLPYMAKNHNHLKYSLLALSARQLERRYPDRTSEQSLALYQEAIHLLIPQLQARTTAVIASCVVLCVLEMLSCSPKAWRRHLDGCASLLLSVGIHGFSGGVEQALFWTFARMDVCGGLISSERTLIPISRWTPAEGLRRDAMMFKAAPTFDVQANYAVYLLGQVLHILTKPKPVPSETSVDHQTPFRGAWEPLFNAIEDWYDFRPEEMKSILSIPAGAADQSNPFPTVLYGNSAAISGNQMYHTAALLMLRKKPKDAQLSRKPRSVLWHARQICAISISNTHHGSWTNAVQPLWIAGQVMSHPAEHRAILQLFEKIERETGWGTKWRADDLREYWGDLEGD